MKWHIPELFRCCFFGFCPNQTEWEALRKKVLRSSYVQIGDYSHNTGLVTAFKDEQGRPHFVVTLHERVDGDLPRLIGTIAHEAVHVVEGILDVACEDDVGEETYAWLIGSVSEIIWREYERTRGKK